MIYSIPKIWTGDTCVILAGGPSLKTQSLDALWNIDGMGGIRTIAINDSWQIAPRADVLYFCDHAWWQYQQARNLRSLDNKVAFHQMIYRGNWITTAPAFTDHPQVKRLKVTGERGLETDPGGLRHGSNSGYQAINLGASFGASRIILLGYDMQVVNGRTHWHEHNAQSATEYQTTLSLSMLPHFDSLVEPLSEAGVEVINATPGSALQCWPQMSLEDALNSDGATSQNTRVRLSSTLT